MASLYTGYQAYYGKPIYGLNTNWKGQLKGGNIPPVQTLDQLSPTEIANMSLDDIKAAIPKNKGWNIYKNNGRIHIKDNDGNFRLRIDPPDKVTKYQHIHLYDINGNSLDINGNIVKKNDPAGHIPWSDKQ